MSVAPLIDPEELAGLLAGPDRPAVLDVRWRLGGPDGREEHRRGHIPGAVYVDLDADLAAPPGPGRHPLPDPELFAAAMRRSGVRRDRGVVVHDAADSTSAVRAWWLLRDAGHPDVRVLDGGLRAWVEAGLPVSAVESRPEPGDFAAEPGHLRRLDAAQAAALAHRGRLLDARAGKRYRGEVEPVDPVAGHIPGAISAPTAGNVDDGGRFLRPERLQQRFDALGVRPGVEVGAYCGSGVTASHEVLALELAGIEAALYPGSWSEWITDPTRPVATGAEPG